MDISKMTRGEIEEYLDFLLRQYRLVDGLWFLAVEDRFGLEAAVKLNEEVWARIGTKAAREIKVRFNIRSKGIPAVLEALSYFPWSIIIPYEVEQAEDRAVLRVPNCLPQEARLRLGRGEFPCKVMQLTELSNFAKVIDERVEVRCRYAPPDERPGEAWCEWEFSLRKPGSKSQRPSLRGHTAEAPRSPSSTSLGGSRYRVSHFNQK
ncbi:MAG: DUF6125 family protein [Candidatus Geothermarchaeales archaeon]